jgi:hypothetical protein
MVTVCDIVRQCVIVCHRQNVILRHKLCYLFPPSELFGDIGYFVIKPRNQVCLQDCFLYVRQETQKATEKANAFGKGKQIFFQPLIN